LVPLIYFKVSVISPKGGLDNKMVADPYPMIAQTAGAETAKPLSQIHVKDSSSIEKKSLYQ